MEAAVASLGANYVWATELENEEFEAPRDPVVCSVCHSSSSEKGCNVCRTIEEEERTAAPCDGGVDCGADGCFGQDVRFHV